MKQLEQKKLSSTMSGMYLRNIALAAMVGITAATTGCSDSANNSELHDEIDPNQDDYAIGRGYNTVTADPMGDCVEGTLSTMTPSAGFSYSFTLEKVTSSEQLLRKLQVEAKAKYSAGLGSMSAKAKFTESQSINQQSLYLTLAVQVTSPMYTLADARLKPAFKQLLQSDTKAFQTRCGDDFVRSYVAGGEYIAVLKIETTSEEHKQAIEAKMRGSYGTFGGSVQLSSSFQEVLTENRTEIFIYQSGGKFEKVSITADELVRAATDFPTTVTQANAVPITFITASYEILPDLPASPIDLEQQATVMTDLANQDLYLSDISSTIDFILTHQDQYSSLDIKQLNDTSSQVKNALNLVRSSAKECALHYNCALPTYAVPTFTPPTRVQAAQPAPPAQPEQTTVSPESDLSLQEPRSDSGRHQWLLKQKEVTDKGIVYVVVNMRNGGVLRYDSDLRAVTVERDRGDDSQLWLFKNTDDPKVFEIYNLHKGRFLEYEGRRDNADPLLTTRDDDGRKSLLWRIKRAHDGVMIINEKLGLALGI